MQTLEKRNAMLPSSLNTSRKACWLLSSVLITFQEIWRVSPLFSSARCEANLPRRAEGQFEMEGAFSQSYSFASDDFLFYLISKTPCQIFCTRVEGWLRQNSTWWVFCFEIPNKHHEDFFIVFFFFNNSEKAWVHLLCYRMGEFLLTFSRIIWWTLLKNSHVSEWKTHIMSLTDGKWQGR